MGWVPILPIPTHGWPSSNLINENTEFPIYLLEVNTNGNTLPNHHELFVDLSAVYGIDPVNFEVRTPDGTHIPICGAILHMSADIIPSRHTRFMVEYWATEDGPSPIAAYLIQRVQLLGHIRDMCNTGIQVKQDGTRVFDATLFMSRLSTDAAELFRQKRLDPNGNPKLWGTDWHCQIYANQLAARWNVSTDYPHHDIVEAPVAEAMLQAVCKVATIVQKTSQK